MSSKSGYFVLTLPLAVEKWQADILDRRMEVNEDIYNALLGRTMKRYRQRDALVEQYRLRRFDLTKDAARYRQAFKENTDSPIVQNLAENVWRAVDRLITGRGKQMRFKKERELNDLSGKTNRASIMYRNGYVKWKGLLLNAVSKNNVYEWEALQHEIRCCRIKRREIRGKWKYYVDLVMEGCAPLKHPEVLEAQGNVGIVVEPGSIRVDLPCGKHCKRKLAPDTSADRKLEREKEEALHFLYRSRRAMNPQNYTEEGIIRSGAVGWVYSKRYRKERACYRELCRKRKERRRQYQCRLTNELLFMGSHFYMEESDFAMMKRSVYQTGPGRRKRYRREITDGAPGTFTEIFKKKCMQYGKGLDISPFEEGEMAGTA